MIFPCPLEMTNVEYKDLCLEKDVIQQLKGNSNCVLIPLREARALGDLASR
jgi:hypothetical protein